MEILGCVYEGVLEVHPCHDERGEGVDEYRGIVRD
jgi:hypothetical protein